MLSVRTSGKVTSGSGLAECAGGDATDWASVELGATVVGSGEVEPGGCDEHPAMSTARTKHVLVTRAEAK
jgi:hypothetical protein